MLHREPHAFLQPARKKKIRKHAFRVIDTLSTGTTSRGSESASACGSEVGTIVDTDDVDGCAVVGEEGEEQLRRWG
jgi:hypothetical protein